RYIYDDKDKNISFSITNESRNTYGGQVWIDGIGTLKNSVNFITIPSFFKVDGRKKQIIRIMKIGTNLPKDRESLFWLNVQEIPQINKKHDANIIALAINTKVKLIYRPDTLQNGRLNAEKNIVIKKDNGEWFIENPTPYYFAIINMKINGKTVGKTKLNNQLSTFEPKGKISLNALKIAQGDKVTIETIDDFGAQNNYEVPIK
uniref:fimbrial chaperone n=2 Tax=Photobacterium lucens TaxID=2562949 RepID=UPI001367E500